MTKAWSPEDRAAAYHLWSRGVTGSEIAAILGRTRNAVLGMLHRAGKGGDAEAAEAIGRKAAFRPDVHAAAKVGAAAAGRARLRRRAQGDPTQARDQYAPHCRIEWVKLVDRKAHQCCWPIGSPFDDTFRFCGRARGTRGESYCDHHAEKSYTPFGLRSLQNSAYVP